jgi:hypothetical protein
MKWKFLALLPYALCGNLAFGQLPGGDPSTEANFDYSFFDSLNGATVGGSGSGTGPTSPIFWSFVNGIESFPNPEGGSAQVSVFPVPWVAATASSVAPQPNAPTINFTTTTVGLQYYIQLMGSSPTTPVTLFWNGAYSLSGATNGLDGFSDVDVTVGSAPQFVDGCNVEASCPSGFSSVFTGSLTVPHTATVHVGLGAIAYSQNGGEAGSAYIDPYFYLSPAEIAAGDTLSFSASVGNSPVPLPATDGLLLTGLGLLTIARLRRNPTLLASRS